MTENRKITNPYFQRLREVFEENFPNTPVLSGLKEASKNAKGKLLYTDGLDMEIVKLDDFSNKREYLLPSRVKEKKALPAVDAICIDSDNQWFLIEFKNAPLKNEEKSIRKKMVSSLWYLFFLYSRVNPDDTLLFDGNMVKFAIEHITYIVVVSHEDNTDVAQKIFEQESCEDHYTPPSLETYKHYYFKDVYLLTEREFRTFVHTFKV